MKVLLFLMLVFSLPVKATELYHNDSAGNAVSGSLYDLDTAVRAGKHIRLIVPLPDRNLDMFIDGEDYFISSTGVVCLVGVLNAINASYNIPSDIITFNSTHSTAIFCSNGKEKVVVNGNVYINYLDMIWVER